MNVAAFTPERRYPVSRPTVNEVGVLADLKTKGAAITVKPKGQTELIGRIVWSDLNCIAVEVATGRVRVFNKIELEFWEYASAH
ncbi:hypothetical protein [Azospirillum sp. Sh1]|uniref:hypothetical protein n=1 Tax=Azospirillum sp. Sh1 TaxID=2607285 RepID=UPI0011F07C7F|nr:hypothetical protein [Azospirillum sp. Sh1]KAA0573393.1 hypothetical protein FZ029_20665 [Azospirillum sp. Sh1]